MRRNVESINKEIADPFRVSRETLWMADLLLKMSYLSAKSSKPPRWVPWHPLGEDVVVLNVDGSSLTNLGLSGFGGVLRTGDRVWISGFLDFLGEDDNLKAELVAIYRGAKLAWDMECRRVVVYSDSTAAIELVVQPCNPCHQYAAIVHLIQDLLQKQWTVELTHTLREGNQIADWLAKAGARQSLPWEVLVSLPVALGLSLLADSWRVFYPRER